MHSFHTPLAVALLAGLVLALPAGTGAVGADATPSGAALHLRDGSAGGASGPGEDAMLLAGLCIGIALVLLGAIRNLVWRLRQRDEGTW